jgi:hypothetical protein
MLEDGTFKQLSDSDTLPTPKAEPYLRIFPRRVTLAPGESQVVRLQYRKVPGMADGEFRSHLYFRADKNTAPLGMTEQRGDTTSLSVSLTPIYGISIPIIIRSGNLSVKVSLSDLSVRPVNDSTYHMSVTINRSGNQSAYGTIEVSYVTPSGDSKMVGVANGIGIYTELNKRIYSMPVKAEKGFTVTKGGKWVVRFLTPKEAGSSELARAEYPVS